MSITFRICIKAVAVYEKKPGSIPITAVCVSWPAEIHTVIFHFFMLFFFLCSLNFISFRLYFHGADNWAMNYRHHELLFFDQSMAEKCKKNRNPANSIFAAQNKKIRGCGNDDPPPRKKSCFYCNNFLIYSRVSAMTYGGTAPRSIPRLYASPKCTIRMSLYFAFRNSATSSL